MYQWLDSINQLARRQVYRNGVVFAFEGATISLPLTCVLSLQTRHFVSKLTSVLTNAQNY